MYLLNYNSLGILLHQEKKIAMSFQDNNCSGSKAPRIRMGYVEVITVNYPNPGPSWKGLVLIRHMVVSEHWVHSALWPHLQQMLTIEFRLVHPICKISEYLEPCLLNSEWVRKQHEGMI
jgi:hypothetical protein